MQSNIPALENNFNEAYKKLNEQQRKAVDIIEGPVMVIAEPGSGKTQILALRIVKILLKTGALPSNILCITSTETDIIALRKRLLQLMDADAYKINICTFKTFCEELIQDNLWLFEKMAFEPISVVESIQLFKMLMDDLKKDHLLKRYRGDVYFEINNLKDLFSLMKHEGWTTVFMKKKIHEYLAHLPLRDEYIAKDMADQFGEGTLRSDKIEAEIEKMQLLRAAVNEFDNYQNLLHIHKRYDVEDMINWVIREFEENIPLLTACQGKFRYILVNEFQNTCGSENKLLQLLVDHQIKPNLFVIGDGEKSIDYFHEGSMKNMMDFAGRYSTDLIKIVLTNNYRIEKLMHGIEKSFKNKAPLIWQITGKDSLVFEPLINKLKHKPVLNEYSCVKAEIISITNNVYALIEQGILPEKIAVIFNDDKYCNELSEYFLLKKIPFYSKQHINILEQPFVKKILQVLRYLYAEHDTPYGGDQLLFEILHFDFYNIPPIEIAKLTVEVNSKKYNGEPISIRKLLYDKANTAPKNLFDKDINEGLKKISAIVENLIADVANVSLNQLLQNIIHNTGLLVYITNSNQKFLLTQLLTALYDFITIETYRNPYLQLKDLISSIDLMIKEGLPVPMIKVTGNDKNVNLLTIHNSNYLEFDYIFVAGINAASWEKKPKRHGSYTLPDTLFSSQTKTNEENALRRLFYSARHREAIHLNISYARLQNNGKEREPSIFITEIIKKHALTVQKINITDEQIMEFQLLNFTAKAPEIENTAADLIAPILNKFVLSVSALNTYLNCPLGFYYKNILRIPAGKSDTLAFGSAIHHALEKLFRKMQDGRQNKFPSVDEMISDFNWYMHRHRAYFTQESFNRRMEQGIIIISPYYNTYINNWSKVVAIERNIGGVQVRNVPIKGKLDKLEFNGKEINVVDYKTGDVDKALTKMKAPQANDPNGGDYWRQAVFYKILIDNYTQKDWKVISSTFDFVEPDKNKIYRKEKITITAAHIETVTQQIVTVWQKIQQRQFYTGCGKKECHWCNFVKDNKLAVALHDTEEIETD